MIKEMLKIKRIAFDFDGVIAATDKEKRKWLEKKNIVISNTDKTCFYQELKDSFEYDEIDRLYKDMSKNIYTQQTMDKTEPVEGAISAIKRLYNKYKIYIVTARPNEMLEWVTKWLNKYDIDDKVVKVISSSNEDKQDICMKNDIFCLCDDDIRHVCENKINMRILFGTNLKEQNYSNLIVTNSWNEIENILNTPNFEYKNKTRFF